MIKVSIYTDKNLTSGSKSVSILRVRKDGTDVDMKSVVVDGSQKASYMTMLTMKAAMYALDGSIDFLEFHTNNQQVIDSLKWSNGGWEKKVVSGACKDLIEEFRDILPPESFKVHKLHAQEANKMKAFGEDQLLKLEELINK